MPPASEWRGWKPNVKCADSPASSTGLVPRSVTTLHDSGGVGRSIWRSISDGAGAVFVIGSVCGAGCVLQNGPQTVSNGSQICAVPKSSAVGVTASVGGKKPLHVSVAVLLPLPALLATTIVDANVPDTGAL